MTVDAANGLVFVPMGQPTDQNFGSSRPGSNLYSSSVIALDMQTGKLKWHFQMTHHDIYDWDANAPPTLIDVPRNGAKIPALAQSTKQGLLFILNRLTGEPLFGVEERPVPALDALGDQTWPTQPFPLKPAPISRTSMTRDETNKLSPQSDKACKALFDTMVNSGPYTPYGMVPSLVFPSSEGGGSWSGASYDPTRGLIFVNTRSLGTAGELRPSTSSGILPSFGKVKIPFDDPDGYPCSAPPWGELMAISAETADIVWRVPLGEYKELTKKGIPKTGTPNAGGPIVTASGLLFIGSTTDAQFRAFDSKTGKELWAATLPNDAIATPLTYMGRNGKQYVATVAGGGLDNFVKPPLAAPRPNVLVAYKLP
jgi:quinoprotein glucose dehydrogenase